MEKNNQHAADELSRTYAAVRMSIEWMGITRCLTAQQKEELGARQTVDVKMITASRKILDQSHPVMRKISGIRTQIRRTWMDSTLPYVESGIRLLPRPDLRRFHEQMSQHKVSLQEANRELQEDYDHLREDAKRRLGNLYDPADYPASINGLFDLNWFIMEIQPPQYLMKLDPELYRDEQARVQEKFREAVDLAEQAFLTEFASLVEHLTERLTAGENGERKVFRDSAVANLLEFIDRFKHLNVGSHPDLDRLVEQTRQMIQGTPPQSLRDQSGLRQTVATQLSAVTAELDGLMVSRPRRRIVRMESANAGTD